MLQLFRKQRMWRTHGLKRRYDAVIIGAGVHGLATAYYLGKEFGITNVAILEKSYLGAGNSGRNTAIVRANYRTPEGVPFYAASLKLYEEMSRELEWNILFDQCGHLSLAHTDSSVNGLRIRAETNKLLGIDSRLIFPKEIKELVPALDLSPHTHQPILAALYHPPGGTIRHDAVIWAYARACDRMGIEIHPYTEAVGIEVGGRNGATDHGPRTTDHGTTGPQDQKTEPGRPDASHLIPHTAYPIPHAPGLARTGNITGVVTNRGTIYTPIVANCTSGWCSTISAMVGLQIPIVSMPLQACVTEPLKPFLDKVIVSATLHVYVNQSDRGELIIGAEIDPYQTYSMMSTLPTLEQMATYTLELFPQLHNVKVMRQWGGICDMTPDFCPIISGVDGLAGFYMDVGWGTYGFKAGPIAGKCLAELIATGETPKLIRPFSLLRFFEDRLVGEKAAAAVSH